VALCCRCRSPDKTFTPPQAGFLLPVLQAVGQQRGRRKDWVFRQGDQDHKQLCLGSSTDRLNSSILLASPRRSPTHSEHPTQTMALKPLLVLLPLQSLLLFAPAGQAHTTGTTRFLPEGYRGPVCRALKPGCMTKSQWAKRCRSYSLFPRKDIVMSKSCRDALDTHRHNHPEPPTTFLPENFPEMETRCIAITPSCMKRSEWAKWCAGWKQKDPNFIFPKSCRDALGVRPINYRPYLPPPRNVRPAPPIRLPNLKTGVTCLAFSEACMSREDWAKVCASASNPAQLGCKPSSL